MCNQLSSLIQKTTRHLRPLSRVKIPTEATYEKLVTWVKLHLILPTLINDNVLRHAYRVSWFKQLWISQLIQIKTSLGRRIFLFANFNCCCETFLWQNYVNEGRKDVSDKLRNKGRKDVSLTNLWKWDEKTFGPPPPPLHPPHEHSKVAFWRSSTHIHARWP